MIQQDLMYLQPIPIISRSFLQIIYYHPQTPLFCYSPLTCLGQNLELLLEIVDDLLVLLLQDVRRLLRLEVHVVQQFAQLQQLDVAAAVDAELRLGAAFGLLEALGHLDDLDAEVGLLTFDLLHSKPKKNKNYL